MKITEFKDGDRIYNKNWAKGYNILLSEDRIKMFKFNSIINEKAHLASTCILSDNWEYYQDIKEYKGIFTNEETRDSYEFLINSGHYVSRALYSCKTPKDVRYLVIDMWPDCAKSFIDKVNFDEIFELVVR